MTGPRVIPADPEKAAAARRSRQAPFGILTSGCMVHYAGPGQRNYVAQTGFDRRVAKPEQVYVRDTALGTDWIAVDTGWIKTPGMILIVNKLPKGSTGTVFVGIGVLAFAKILPGESCCFHPDDASNLCIKADVKDSPITIHAFPG